MKAKIGDIVLTCFFHLRQTVFRHIQAEGLQIAYNNRNDRSIKHAAQKMCALAFVPVKDVVKCFDVLKHDLPDTFLPIAQYLEEYYVRGVPGRKG